MAELLKGINVVSPIVPMTSEDVYPTHIANYGKGGYHIVQKQDDLKDIPIERLVQGTAAYVTEENLIYTLRSTDEDIQAGKDLEWAVASVTPSIYYGTEDVSTDGQVYVKNSEGNEEMLDASEGDFYLYKNPDNNILGSVGYIRICTNAKEYEEYLAKVKKGESAEEVTPIYKWAALAGRIKAENVYFDDGISRTEAWGVETATSGGIVSEGECKGKNLKDLLENYLVKEAFPEKISTGYGIYETPINFSISNYGELLNINNITTINSAATVDVGTLYKINSCSYTPEIVASEGDKSINIGGITATGFSYGYFANETDASNNTNKQTNNYYSVANSQTINCTYANNVNTATNKYDISITGFRTAAGGSEKVNDITATATGNNVISIPDTSLYVAEGSNNIKVTFSSDASITQTITNPNNLTFSEMVASIYAATNKGNGKLDGKYMTYKFDGSTYKQAQSKATLSSSSISSSTITGAWRIYSNVNDSLVTTASNYSKKDDEISNNNFLGNDTRNTGLFTTSISNKCLYMRCPVITINEQHWYIWTPYDEKNDTIITTVYGASPTKDGVFDVPYKCEEIESSESDKLHSLENAKKVTHKFHKYEIATGAGSLSTVKISFK